MKQSRCDTRPKQKIRLLSLMWSLLALTLAIVGSAFADSQLGAVHGEVQVGQGSPPTWHDAVSGAPIAPGDIIRTGSKGRAEIHLSAGSVRLYENSLLRVPGTSGASTEVELERGSSVFDVLRRELGQRFQVRTPEVVVSVKGTRFSLDLSGELASVAVFRGTVGVRSPGMDLALETLIREGFAATGGREHVFELELAPERDPWHSWELADRLPDLAARRIERVHEQRAAEDARAAALESTSLETVERAAKRNPEIAERLQKIRARQQRDERERGERHEEVMPSVVPAAPAPGNHGISHPQRPESKRESQDDHGQLRPAVEHLLRERQLTQDAPEQVAADIRSRVGLDEIQQILSDFQDVLPGAAANIDPSVLLATYEGFITNLYVLHSQELAEGGIDAYIDLLADTLVSRGIVAPDNSKDLAERIVDAIR